MVSPRFINQPEKGGTMEKLLLVMALFGSAQIALRGLWKLGKLAFALAMPKPAHPGTVRAPDVRPMAVRKDGEEDWSAYDVPAYIRRGIPMPELEPVQAKTRKRRSKAKSDVSITPGSSDVPAFEIIE